MRSPACIAPFGAYSKPPAERVAAYSDIGVEHYLQGKLFIMISANKIVMDILREYSTPSNSHGILRIGIDWTLIILFSCSYFIFSEINNFFLILLIYLLSVMVIAVRLSGLEACTHEATHYTLFRTKSWNNSLQFLFAFPVLQIVETYRRNHMIHHRDLGQENDPAVQYYRQMGVLNFPKDFYWIMIIRPLLGYHTWFFIREKIDDILSQPFIAVKMASFWLPVGIALYYTEKWVWFALYFLVPLFLILPVLLFWSEVFDHVSLDWKCQLRASRNNIGFSHRFIYPHHEGYHLIHHLHAGVPTHRLAEAYKRLLEIPHFRQACISSNGILDTMYQLRNQDESGEFA